MTLKEYIASRPDNEDYAEFTVFDKDYDVEVYFYHPDMEEPWDMAMDTIASKLNVIEYSEEDLMHNNPQVTVDLSDLIERNINNGAFERLFIHNTVDDIMNDIHAIFAGHVSEEWLTEFANSLE